MTATVKFTLDELGRRASLIAGGDGKADQTASIEISATDIDLFSLGSDGILSADCNLGATRSWAGWAGHKFSVPPAAADLIAFLRERMNQRAAADAAAKIEAEEKKVKERAAASLAREAAILALRQALAEGKVITPGCTSDSSLYINSIRINASDPDCGIDVQRMLELAAADRARDANADAQLRRLKEIAAPAKIRLAELTPDGKHSVEIPNDLPGENWAKHVESIDSAAKNGYAFQGPWLRAGKSDILDAGDLVLVGSKAWEGSRKRGDWVHYKSLYIVTPAGLLLVAENDAARNEAIRLLALSVSERLETIMTKAAATCERHIAAFDALDRAEYLAVLAKLDSRRASWAELLALCRHGLAEPAADAEITDLDSAAAAIVTAGFRALSKIHHPDAGGAAQTMALLTQARGQLRDMLKLAGVR
jgi:hypothetical protein